MINIVLCGGSGTRLWPMSRTLLPKQFVRLFNGKSLFQETLLRNRTICEESFIVSNIEQYFLAQEQLEEVNQTSTRFLLEPVGRNTAPAIALACMAMPSEEIVFVTPSDHLVKNQSAYESAILRAKELASQNFLVTFGIQPTYPETGFGYIEAKGSDVLSFKEKPSVDVAQTYLEQGNYYWNSGMFCFKAGVFLEELRKNSPEIFDACQQAVEHFKRENEKNIEEIQDINIIRIDPESMKKIPEDSIDYAVMEKSDRVKVVPCDIGWSDLGSYDALYEELGLEEGNAHLQSHDSSPKPISINSKNNLIVSRDRQIALIDVEELLVVDTSDAILISKKGSSQKVKQVVSHLKEHNPELTEVHRLAHRPWGTYEVLLDTQKYKIKRIIVKPGSKLSLQKHFHRNEHWIVVSGTATVTVGSETYLVRPNESTYIKMGENHRLENEGRIDLVMIEVQVGEYTGEDDIIRVEDMYMRR